MTSTLSDCISGVGRLLERLDKESSQYQKALALQYRLHENFRQAEQFGDHGRCRADRAQIVGALNRLALETLGMSFNDLCGFSTRPDREQLESWYQEGIQAIKKGRYDTAIKCFEQVVAHDPLYKNTAELLEEVKLKQETQEARLRVRVVRILHHPVFQRIGVIVAVLALLCAIVASIGVPLFPLTMSSPSFSGKVCQIKEDWDTDAIFLRKDHFNALGIPIGTQVTVAVRDTDKSVENVTLSLDSRLEICSVRLAKPLREALGVDADTAIEPERNRPDRSFDVTQTSPPANEEEVTIQGKVCMIKSGQDTETVFLRQAEFDAFGIPAGTTVSVTAVDTGKTIEEVTLSLDSSLATCVVRIAPSFRGALELSGDTGTPTPENRPDRQFLIQLPQP